jgi:hypothetical protein
VRVTASGLMAHAVALSGFVRPLSGIVRGLGNRLSSAQDHGFCSCPEAAAPPGAWRGVLPGGGGGHPEPHQDGREGSMRNARHNGAADPEEPDDIR